MQGCLQLDRQRGQELPRLAAAGTAAPPMVPKQQVSAEGQILHLE